jgi:hypothetical protein
MEVVGAGDVGEVGTEGAGAGGGGGTSAAGAVREEGVGKAGAGLMPTPSLLLPCPYTGDHGNERCRSWL